MILKEFLQGNLIFLYIRIIKSMIIVGFYYGVLTTLSIGPSYLFLLQICIREDKNNKPEKKISAITGFITGQLMLFMSIYYTPFHLALNRPHTTTVLILPYFLVYFFWTNHKYLFNFESTTKNSMRNIYIPCIFLTNLIFQLFNHFILPSSMLARLINIYMFRCTNKFFFVTSSFVGWLISHILFMKWIRFVFIWIQQNNFIKSHVIFLFTKDFVSELLNYLVRIFCILLFITCVCNLGRIPSPILTKKFIKEPLKTKEKRESNEKISIETEKTYELTGIKKDEQNICTELSLFLKKEKDPDKVNEMKDIILNGKTKTKDKFDLKKTSYKDDPFPETVFLDNNQNNYKLKSVRNKKDKNCVWFEKPFVTFLFDYKRWNRPLRYIKNNKFENTVINQMSQYFFYICQSDGKLKITFTYLPSLLTFLKLIQKKIFLSTLENFSYNKLYNYWIYTNEQKSNKQNNGVIYRIETLDKDFFLLDILEKRSKFCNYNKRRKQKEYLPKIYDPFLNGSYRGTIKKMCLPSIITETSIKNSMETVWINKIHGIFFTNLRKYEQKLEKKTLSTITNYFFTLIGKFYKKLPQNLNLFPEQVNSENLEIFFIFLFKTIMTDTYNKKPIKKIYIEEKEIYKKVLQRSYKLIDALEQQERENGEDTVPEDHQIRSRKAKRVVIFTDKYENTNTYTYINTQDTNDLDQTDELTLYSQQSDFRQDIIKGSMRTQRRKTVIWELFQTTIHSPFFFDRKEKISFFFISELLKFFFKHEITGVKVSDYKEEETKKRKKSEQKKKEEKARIEITETCDTILFSQRIRGCILVTQSIFRKKIKLPSLIIAKNIIRMLLFQRPEWSEDLEEWNREIHIKCTYNGVQLSETEFPKNWLTEGIQIKILFPFCLKPWHRSKSHINLIKQKDDFCFLTVWGMETKELLGSPRKKHSFFEPIFKKVEKKIKQFKINFSIINNHIFHKSSIENQNKSKKWTKYSLVENKVKNLTDKINTIQNEIEKITKDNKKVLIKKLSINKKSLNLKKRQESPKNIFYILKKRNVRIIQKFHYFLKYSLAKIYLNILLYMINFYSLNVELFIESTKKIKVDKKKQITINFISVIKKLFYSNATNNLYIFFNLFFFSQIKMNNVDKLRDLLKYYGIPFFIKNEIKYFFAIQGIFHFDFKLRYKKHELNQWKNWLRGQYQYDLSPIIWSQLMSQKWKIKINQNFSTQSKNLNKGSLYEKTKLINSEETLLSNQKDNFKKHYRYARLSYKYIIYGSSLQQIKNKEGSYFNYNTHKQKLFNILWNTPINNEFQYDNMKNMGKNLNKKNFYNNEYLKNENRNFKIIDNNNSILDIRFWFFPQFLFLSNEYMIKPWVIPIKFLILNFNENKNSKVKTQFISKINFGTNTQKKENCKFLFSNQQKYFEYGRPNRKKQYKNNTEGARDLFLKSYLLFQLRWDDPLNQKIINNIKVYSFLLRLINFKEKEIVFSSIRRREMSLDLMLIQKNLILTELTKKGILIIEPIYISVKSRRQFILYQTLSILLIQKNKYQTTKKYEEQRYINKIQIEKSIAKHQTIIKNKKKNYYDLVVPENILLPRHCKKFRILICLNSRNRKTINKNLLFCNEVDVKNCGILDENNYFNKKQFIKLKFFLWPNYQFEDLICTNRYWFDTNNSSQFSMLRIQMYPQVKIY